MQSDHITEEAFLLVELDYSLAQLRTQLRDLGDPARSRKGSRPLRGSRTLSSILEAMMRYETDYQAQYQRLLHVEKPADPAEAEMAGYDGFERTRRQTIAMLNRAGDEWPAELLHTVKQQVADDREHVTRIAELRSRLLEDHATDR